MPANERKLIIKSLIISIIFIVLITILPSKLLLKIISTNPKLIKRDHSHDESLDLITSKKAISRISKIFPKKMHCLVKALSLRYLLKDYGIKSALILSIEKKTDHQIIAHAYISVNSNHHIFKNNEFIDVYKFNVS